MNIKQRKIALYDACAPRRDEWKKRNRYYHDDIKNFLSFLIPKGKSVLELGCGTGDLLVHLEPSRGVGVDISEKTIEEALRKYPPERHRNVDFRTGDAEDLEVDGTFDYVVMSDLVGDLVDVWSAFRSMRKATRGDSRVVITYFNALWEPILRLGERLRLKMPQDRQNWLSLDDLENLLDVNGFEVYKRGYRLLFPKWVPLLSWVANTLLARVPGIRKLCLVIYLVARPRDTAREERRPCSVSVVVPTRNERGNIAAAVERIPDMGSHTEIVFVDGNSSDGTVREIEEAIKRYEGVKDIRLLHQVQPGSSDGTGHGKMLKLGKGDAVRKGFEAATGEILMILDADLTVSPEDLPKFYLALHEGYGEFVNGSRLAYPLERDSMRTLNKLGNKFFSRVFTWLLDQRVRDTLCGTKVLFRKDYLDIAANRKFFGDFDPFGDFDLLFGAAKQNLKIVEIPIRYKERTYGEIKIRRFRHGMTLLRMSAIGALKLKFR